MTRDAEVPAGDYLELVLAGISQETEIGTVQSLLRLARQSIDPFGDPARRDDRTRRLAAKALELLEGAEPGSDMQLAFTRSLAANAVTDEQLALLRRPARRRPVGRRPRRRHRAALDAAATSGRHGPGR